VLTKASCRSTSALLANDRRIIAPKLIQPERDQVAIGTPFIGSFHRSLHLPIPSHRNAWIFIVVDIGTVIQSFHPPIRPIPTVIGERRLCEDAEEPHRKQIKPTTFAKEDGHRFGTNCTQHGQRRSLHQHDRRIFADKDTTTLVIDQSSRESSFL